mgnify:CR=1 FL=1
MLASLGWVAKKMQRPVAIIIRVSGGTPLYWKTQPQVLETEIVVLCIAELLEQPRAEAGPRAAGERVAHHDAADAVAPLPLPAEGLEGGGGDAGLGTGGRPRGGRDAVVAHGPAVAPPAPLDERAARVQPLRPNGLHRRVHRLRLGVDEHAAAAPARVEQPPPRTTLACRVLPEARAHGVAALADVEKKNHATSK